MDIKLEKKLVGACGLYCRLCPEHEDFQKGFAESAERILYLATQMVQANAWPWDINDPESNKKFFNYYEFIKELQWLANQKQSCRGCKFEVVPSTSLLLPGQNPECKIKDCCFGKGFRFCYECPDFACNELIKLRQHYPYCLRNSRRMKDVGIEKWLKEQQIKVRAGSTNRK